MPTTPDYYRQYYQKNKEKIQARAREYSKTPEQRAKHAARERAWRKKNTEKYRAYERNRHKRRPRDLERKAYVQLKVRLRKIYKITEAEYWAMLDAQNHTCLGCLTPFEVIPCVDHDHKTGKVRGALCTQCNHVVGHSYDNPATLRRLADYLDRANSGVLPQSSSPTAHPAARA